ncbi:MAG: LTA synthase family protein [Muribaculaceae bacterium]|nr:LTA synthase family protein [Roseburia sp.]MCM1431378.1 LTA synthase family protein [Muribaculaceae bacterium]MCM1491820.1 LTA synthase family protein [Muribaculaceae bacterium]
MKRLTHLIKKLFTKTEKEHSEAYLRRTAFFNKYSLLFHALISCVIVFVVEMISRRSFLSACTFVAWHTGAFLYNAFIVFASLCLVYLFRRRLFARTIISGFWIILGVINGCILSNRVTPFGFTDLKCINDLFAMNNTNYFTAEEATLVVIGLAFFALCCVLLFIKGPKYQGKIHKIVVFCAIVCVLFIGIPVTTNAAQSANVVASYFSNIAQGYENYGFIYGFSSSVMGRGMDKPETYSKEAVTATVGEVNRTKEETAVTAENAPNIICVLLESFCDPDEIKFLNYEKDPVPTFHYLEENFSTGYLTVPVVGAGTANTEFEILSGMSMQYFGTGEYPYKTILKKTDCESIASDLSAIGYGTHAVHNNGGNFYSRVNAFSMMGFDSFTSKELMNIQLYTPNGSWADDSILVDETVKTLDATPHTPDFTYTITVGTHGDYPKEPVITPPKYVISGVEDEAAANQWTYYVNQLNEVDTFMADLINKVNSRNEDTVIVFFGDHLPTMGLTDGDMVSGDIYKTNYVTWNNMGLKKQDADLYAYQLLASITDSVGIHEGTVLSYHQTQADSPDYLSGLENLQYDILYGDRYCYDGEDRYPATDIVMGIDEVTIESVVDSVSGDKVILYGSGFTKWSRVYVNGEKVSTSFSADDCLVISREGLADGDELVVNQLGSSSTIFRSSNAFTYRAAGTEAVQDTEDALPSEMK